MINIGFVIDNNYCKYTAVVIASILKSGKDNEYAFHIIHDGSISQYNKDKINELKKIKDFSITYYAQNKELHHEQRKDTRSDIPMVTNYRMMISSILKDIEKIIFMDADLIVVNDIKELWDIDVENYYIACCSSESSPFIDDYKKEIGIPNEYNYCNTGVMLANLKKWRDDGIESKLFEKEKQYRGIYRFYDQCVFNMAMYDKIKYINQKYNFRPGVWENTEYMQQHYGKNTGVIDINPVVIHWASPVKPWQNNTVPFADDYFAFAKYTPYYFEIKVEAIFKFKSKNIVVAPTKLKYKWYEKLFSIKTNSKSRKVITILGIHIKI